MQQGPKLNITQTCDIAAPSYHVAFVKRKPKGSEQKLILSLESILQPCKQSRLTAGHALSLVIAKLSATFRKLSLDSPVVIKTSFYSRVRPAGIGLRRHALQRDEMGGCRLNDPNDGISESVPNGTEINTANGPILLSLATRPSSLPGSLKRSPPATTVQSVVISPEVWHSSKRQIRSWTKSISFGSTEHHLHVKPERM
jgi:hypothetical protein